MEVLTCFFWINITLCYIGVGDWTGTWTSPWLAIVPGGVEAGTTTTIVPGPIRITGKMVGLSSLQGNWTAIASGKSAGSIP